MSRYSHVDATSEGLRSLCGKCWIAPEQVKWNRSKKCGEGAYAIVVKGKLALPGGGHEEVAVKQLKPDKMEELDKKDFILEATVLSKLKHPCIVNMFGVGADGDESFFLVSEFMNGGSLKEILWRQMEVPFRRLYSDADAARWCLQIARGLAYLHDCSPLVIHRDLKPENVLLKGPSPSKQDAKLADFGLHILVAKQAQLKAVQTLKRIATRRPSATALMAEEAEALRGAPPSVISEGTTPTISPTTSGEKWGRQFSGASRQSSRASMVSRVNSVKPMRSSSLAKLSAVRSDAGGIEGSYELTGCTGSFLYMAPEVFRGLNYNEKVDVYSFGMIAFELFAHELTFYGMQCRDQVVELMDYVESVALDGFRPEFPPHMPPEVVAIVRRCWDVEPALRPTMRQVVDDLRAYMRDKGIPESKGLVSSASTTAAGAAAGAGSGKSSGCQCVVS